MDPLTLARLWIMIHPLRRLRERREAKRAALSAATGLSAPLSSPESAAVATDGATLVLPAVQAAEDASMTQEVLLLLIRHGLTFAGGAGLLTDNEYVQLAAAASTLVGLAWSAYRKWARLKAA